MTLAELLIALGLAAGVAVATGQVVTQMTRGAASVDRRAQAQTEAALAMLRMRGELEQATRIVKLTSSQVEFVLPDINSDAAPDTVKYEWSGVVGEPLVRKFNGGAAETILEQCRSFAVSMVAPPVRLEAGKCYPLRVEYFEDTGNAKVSLSWSSPSTTNQVVPVSRLYPAYTPTGSTPPGASGTGLIGEYYDNLNFTTLKMTRLDSTINFNWGGGSPMIGMGSNTFSIRWTGQIKPALTDDYTFLTAAEDGIRVWVDNQLVIDDWSSPTNPDDKGITPGARTVKVSVSSGPADNPVRLEGAVQLFNRPGYGG